MSMKVYMVTPNSGDLPVGSAYDQTTFLSLVELARLKGATHVNLNGVLQWGGPVYSGPMAINDAFALVFPN